MINEKVYSRAQLTGALAGFLDSFVVRVAPAVSHFSAFNSASLHSGQICNFVLLTSTIGAMLVDLK